MKSRGISIDRPRRLPIQVSLRPGEMPDSFVRRLAIANHLRPSYLRAYLADPPGPLASIQIWRLAAVTGRPEEELIRVIPALQPTPITEPSRQRVNKQVGLFAAIRQAAEQDVDVQRLSKHFGLRRPTIIKALTGQDPTTARFAHRRPQHHPILEDVTDYLDQLIADNPGATIWSIWKKLIQERQTTAGYGTVRDYVNRVRAHPGDTKSVRHLVSRADLFTKIRDEAVGLLASRLAAQFSTDRTTVIRALTGEDTPRKRPQSKQNPILKDLRKHIDKMIDSDPDVTVATIWERPRRPAPRRGVLRHRPGLRRPRTPPTPSTCHPPDLKHRRRVEAFGLFAGPGYPLRPATPPATGGLSGNAPTQASPAAAPADPGPP